MFKRTLQISICLIMSLILTVIFANTPLKMLPAPATPGAARISGINSLVVNGNINLHLVQAKSGKANYFAMDSTFRPLVQVVQQGNVLFISPAPVTDKDKKINKTNAPPPGFAMPIPVTVVINRLYELKINDTSSVFASNFNSPDLQLVVNTSGYVSLKGVIGLQNLIITGPAVVSINRVSVPELHIYNTSNATINLTGTIHYLQVRLAQQSRLNATHLYVNTAYVQTRDQSQARLNVSDKLNAFATDQSMILYYSAPSTKIEYSSGLANVLRIH